MTPARLLYRTATHLAAPLLGPVLRWRAGQGKEDPLRLNERRARLLPARLPGELVWLHGASIGELQILLELGRRLIAERPDLMLLFTSQTLTSAKLIAPLLPDVAVHQMAPVDTPGAAMRFIDHWRPSLCIFGEGEIWPNLLAQARRTGAHCALVNARMTEASAKGWEHWKGLFRSSTDAFAVMLAADGATAERLTRLTGRAVAVAGNLKTALPVPAVSEIERQRLAEHFVAGRRCWLAASTHAGEEALFLEAAHEDPETALIVAPRHPARGDEIEALIKSRGLSLARRSRHEAPNAHTRVLLADTIGEMGLWLRLADAVYLGGGHARDVGGHNPLEALQLEKPQVTGPDVFNFSEIMARLAREGLITIAPDADGVRAALRAAAPLPPTALEALRKEAQAPMQATLEALLPLLPRKRFQ